MKFIFLLVSLVSIDAFSKNTYHVELVTSYGVREVVVSAPTDSMALDSVYIGAIYNKRLGKVLKATVKETGLSTEDVPQRVFYVKTDNKSYRLVINVVNPEYALIAIQASKFLMSRTTARDIISYFDDSTLKSRPAVKYNIKYNSRVDSYLLNTESVSQGLVAFDIAAKLSYHSKEYIETYTKPITCGSFFFKRI